MKIEIYHNPRCSKSRATLALLEEKGLSPIVINYLETPPNKNKLKAILRALDYRPRDLMRQSQVEYSELNLDDPSLDNDQLIDAILSTPILLERPIVCYKDRAAIGRPPENVLAILDV